ncbi:MAG: hypothetical protein JST44_22600 [Cyanobacteria bacterium SZAS LIN-5]|nr:hypothetical protein [Cyanobacteria bacterium SZAS LIN-5]
MSILYLAQGTPLSKTAAELAIALARSLRTDVIGQFIIDPQRIFELEGFEGLAGLCGSGVFLEAEQKIIPPLTALGESLLMAFAALAEGQEVRIDSFVDVGSAAEEMALRGKDASLVVLSANKENLPIAERLSCSMTCPILLVQSDTQVLLIEPEHLNAELMSAFGRYVTQTSLKITFGKGFGKAQSAPAAA